MDANRYATSVNRHYSSADLVDNIDNGLRVAGKDPNNIVYSDLSPIDQFHSRGLPATQELARLADLRPGQSVLDVGGGMGGAARVLAAEFGCKVTVLDLTEDFCRAGEILTERTGLQNLVAFKVGNALDIPFPDASFDVAWTQHSTMNIADKARLYAEIHRALRPGGRFAMHELVAGPQQPIYFPVPWADTEDISFLLSPEAIRSLIIEAGFHEVHWEDVTPQTLDWSKERAAAAARAEGPPPLGLHLALGARFHPAFQSFGRNLEEGRVQAIVAVFDKA